MTDTSTNAVFIITSSGNAPYGNVGNGANPGHTGNSGNSGADEQQDAVANTRSLTDDALPASEQTPGFASLLATVDSVNEYAPGSRIAVVQYSAYPFTAAEHETLIHRIDYLMDYSGNEQIKAFDRQLGNNQSIAAFSELTSLLWFLQLGQHHGLYAPAKRVFKMSAGPRLFSKIADSAHYSSNAKGRYVFPNATLAANATGNMALQFSNAFWSFDPGLVPSLISTLEQMIQSLVAAEERNEPASVECLLYKLIDAAKIFYDLKPPVAQPAEALTA